MNPSGSEEPLLAQGLGRDLEMSEWDGGEDIKERRRSLRENPEGDALVEAYRRAMLGMTRRGSEAGVHTDE